MSYKTILVHVDNSARCKQRVELAAGMAVEHGAHLIGLYFGFLPVDFPDVSRVRRQEREQLAEQMFAEVTARCGVAGEWRAPPGAANQLAPVHARYADLIITGQLNHGDEETFIAEQFVERLVLITGRPVLMVPYAGLITPPAGAMPARFDKILLAWNASREAARAGTDALPLLTRAKQVVVMSINPKIDEQQHGDMPGADIALFFARHGVNVAVTSCPGRNDVEAGELLLSRAADLGADLIVMGGYGHPRLEELVLGGVTRTILEAMTVPVLMSH